MATRAALGQPADFAAYFKECLDDTAAKANDYESYIDDSDRLEEAAISAFGDNWYGSKYTIEAIDRAISEAPISDCGIHEGCDGPYLCMELDITEEQVMEQAAMYLEKQEEDIERQGQE
jgi:hypothetical protein